MSNFVLILGETGSGKSTSLKSLNPKETIVINVLGKRLPFKGSASVYNETNKNLFHIDRWEDIIKYLDSINHNATYIKNIVIDDATYIMRTEFFNRSSERGYDKFAKFSA